MGMHIVQSKVGWCDVRQSSVSMFKDMQITRKIKLCNRVKIIRAALVLPQDHLQYFS